MKITYTENWSDSGYDYIGQTQTGACLRKLGSGHSIDSIGDSPYYYLLGFEDIAEIDKLNNKHPFYALLRKLMKLTGFDNVP